MCTDDDVFLFNYLRRDGRLRHAKIQMNLTQKSQKYDVLLFMLSLFKISIRKHTEMICFATGRENEWILYRNRIGG